MPAVKSACNSMVGSPANGVCMRAGGVEHVSYAHATHAHSAPGTLASAACCPHHQPEGEDDVMMLPPSTPHAGTPVGGFSSEGTDSHSNAQFDHAAAYPHTWPAMALRLAVEVLAAVLFLVRMLPFAARCLWAAHGPARHRPASTRNVRYGPRPRNLLDVFPVGGNVIAGEKDVDVALAAPVVVFIHGGAWNSGDKMWYYRIGECMQAHGVVCVVLNYTLFPAGLLDDMLQDIHHALCWVGRHAHEYGGDAARVTLVGHSAGAHLACLYALRRSARAWVCDCCGSEPPSARAFIGLAGVYNLARHYVFESHRGVHRLSALHRVVGGQPFRAHSPSWLVRLLAHHRAPAVKRAPGAHSPTNSTDAQGEDTCGGTDSFRESTTPGAPLPALHLYHGHVDTTVPFSSSAEFAAEAAPAAAPARVRLVGLDFADHTALLWALMDADSYWGALLVRDVVRIARGAGAEDVAG